jgi:arabinose-5-phosphate isomerase
MSDKVKELLEKEAGAIANIPVTGEYEKAVNIIYQQVHGLKGKLVCSGMGKAGQIANNIATTFSSTGTPSDFLHPADAQHGDLGVLQQNDVLLFVSNSGKTREILELYSLSRHLHKLPVILITGNPDGDLVRHADAVLFTGSPDEVCPLGLTPTTSTTAMTVIGDILVVMMMEKIGFTSEDYAKRHHGGYLGHKSRDSANSNESK